MELVVGSNIPHTQCTMFDVIDYEDNYTFGKRPKGTYKPASDFLFNLKCKVTTSNSQGTGYMIDLYPEKRDENEVVEPK